MASDEAKLREIAVNDVVSWRREDGVEVLGKCVGWHKYRFKHFVIVKGHGARDFIKVPLSDVLSRHRPCGETMEPLRFE